MPDPILDEQEVDELIYTKIGAVAAEWSWVETLLADMLAHFYSADHGSMYVITQDVSVSTVVGWLRILTDVKVKDPNSANIILNLLNEIDDARARRNIVVHGNWSGHDTPGFAYVSTVRWTRSEVARSELWSASDLNDLITDIQSLQLQLGNLGLRLGYFHPES